eukprot:scaffold34916_cov170-Amphora_coffeaeformis.AAC.12
MNDLIEILSSDDEKEPVPPAASKKDPSADHHQQNNINDTIDLCESSDDDASQSNMRKIKRFSASFRINSICLSYDDEDEKAELRWGGTALETNQQTSHTKPPPNKSTAMGGTRFSTNGYTREHETSHAQNSLLQKRTKTASKRVTPSLSVLKSNFGDSDDDSDDDELLNTPAWVHPNPIDTPVKSSLPTNPHAEKPASNEKAPSGSRTASSVCAVNIPYTKSRPASTSSSSAVKNPYIKSTPVTTTSATINTFSAGTPFPYPKLTENTKQYPDERARFLLAFWKLGKSNVARSFQRLTLDSISKKIVKLALKEYPVRSIEEFATAGNSHMSVSTLIKVRNDLQKDLAAGCLERLATPVHPRARSKYHSIVEACLVSLLVYTEATEHGRVGNVQGTMPDKNSWMPLRDLIPEVDKRLLPVCPGRLTRRGEEDNGAAHYLNQSTRSIEFLQIDKLTCKYGDSGPYIKKRYVKGQVHYELLPQGLRMAQHIRSRQFPALPGHYRSSKIHSLEQVDTGRYDNICLGVDSREGGGGSKVLHQMCNKLEMMSCPYFVGQLSIGDYVFFTSNGGGGAGQHMNYLLPILVERKSVQDVAQSIYDGRWQRQKHRMYAEKLQEEINNLEAEGFDVLRTTSMENSMFELARWVQKISAYVKSGRMKAQYTYAEFKKKVADVSPQTDFSRLAKYAAAEKKVNPEKRGATDGTTPSTDVENGAPSSKKQKTATEDSTDEYAGWSKKDLEQEAEVWGLTKSGSRADLVARLKGPRPPAAWLERKDKGQYVPPRHNVGNTALLVALYLYEIEVGEENAGMSKAELYVKAASLEITKNPFSGGTTQTGPHPYDGWSGMSMLLE